MARTVSCVSGCRVMKTKGILVLSLTSVSCSSMPFMPIKQSSLMTHPGLFGGRKCLTLDLHTLSHVLDDASRISIGVDDIDCLGGHNQEPPSVALAIVKGISASVRHLSTSRVPLDCQRVGSPQQPPKDCGNRRKKSNNGRC